MKGPSFVNIHLVRGPIVVGLLIPEENTDPVNVKCLDHETANRLHELIDLDQVDDFSTKLQEFHPILETLHIEKSVDEIFSLSLKGPQQVDESDDQTAFHQKRPNRIGMGDHLSNVFDQKNVDRENQT